MWPVLFVLLVSVGDGELRIRDYNGEVKVTRVRLDSIDGCLTYHLDADGDGRKDTLLLYFEQVSYQLVWNTEGEKVTIAGLELDGDAGWLNSQLTVVKPNIIESVHFRGWPVDRYVWDGDKFMKVKLD